MASVSLRPLVLEGVLPFARLLEAEVAATSELLTELIVGISNYREEGLQYAPVVFVTANLEAALARVRGADPLFIGRERLGGEVARSALRRCAPLGEGRRWGVLLRLEDGSCDYGIFALDTAQLRPTSFELLRRTSSDGPATVGITQLRAGVVEVRASAEQGLYFDFSGSPEQARDPGYVVREFVAAVTSSAPAEVRAQLQAFYYRISVDILTGNHGTLLVVVPPDTPPPPSLSDGVWLPTPVSLHAAIARDEAVSTSETARALISYSQLIRRMTMMDGITVFGTDGTVRAYGCFVRDEGVGGASSRIVGGARQRAFERLCGHVGRGLVAALYRSQDGAADCVSSITP